jgi:hypothetical protein
MPVHRFLHVGGVSLPRAVALTAVSHRSKVPSLRLHALRSAPRPQELHEFDASSGDSLERVLATIVVDPSRDATEVVSG